MTILFADVCLLLDRIARIKPVRAGESASNSGNTTTPIAIFRTWLAHLKNATPAQGLILFRLIFPEDDIRRRYGLQEDLLSREIVKALSLPAGALGAWKHDVPSWSDEDRLIGPHTPTGCLGLAIQNTLEARRHASIIRSQSLPIERVDALLDQLASFCPFSSADILATKREEGRQWARSPILSALFESLSAREAAYMTQIILRDLSPIIYPVSSSSTDVSLVSYNSSSLQVLELQSALKEWSWVLPAIYRVRADLDSAFNALKANDIRSRSAYTGSERTELLSHLARPELRTRIDIPKASKGRSCRQVAEICANVDTFSSSADGVHGGKVYLETKYDGERMQIHVDLDNIANPITIFSKSKRDSTMDRARTHPIILAALSASPFLSTACRPTSLLLDRLSDLNCRKRTDSVRTAILEAEMVAYNEHTEKIDEFAYVAECAHGPSAVANAFKGVHGHDGPSFVWKTSNSHEVQTDDALLESSQTSSAGQLLEQDAGAATKRHLAIVFFDCLYLNGKNLMQLPYSERRSKLEQLIEPIEGYSMLAARSCIDFRREGFQAGYEKLVRAFARCIVDRQEGLMIKPAHAVYNDCRPGCQWIKLKRDYIPGLGDTISCCIAAASWTKERGRELRVPSSCFTTFYVGLLENTWELENGSEVRPRYHVLFSVSHLASREMLLHANNRIATQGGLTKQVWSTRMRKSWDFDLTFAPGIEREVSFILRQPLVFELFGAGFTRERGGKNYQLRFPRVSAIHHSRQLDECVNLQDLQRLGRESSTYVDSEAEDEISDLWSRYSSSSALSGEDNISPMRKKNVGWREQQEEEWVQRLLKADRPKSHKRKKSVTSPVATSKTRHRKSPSTDAKSRMRHTNLLAGLQEMSLTPPPPRSPQAAKVVNCPPSERTRDPVQIPWAVLKPSQRMPSECGQASSSAAAICWVTVPRRVDVVGRLPICGRLHSLSALMTGAGYRSTLDTSAAIVGGPDEVKIQYRTAVILTSRQASLDVLQILRTSWSRQVADSSTVMLVHVDTLLASVDNLSQLNAIPDECIIARL